MAYDDDDDVVLMGRRLKDLEEAFTVHHLSKKQIRWDYKFVKKRHNL
jgi:NAD+--asparagine ADP-ribosyltransferase